jgi:hypothetical protein
MFTEGRNKSGLCRGRASGRVRRVYLASTTELRSDDICGNGGAKRREAVHRRQMRREMLREEERPA